jgi:hypothetical protein
MPLRCARQEGFREAPERLKRSPVIVDNQRRRLEDLLLDPSRALLDLAEKLHLLPLVIWSCWCSFWRFVPKAEKAIPKEAKAFFRFVLRLRHEYREFKRSL